MNFQTHKPARAAWFGGSATRVDVPWGFRQGRRGGLGGSASGVRCGMLVFMKKKGELGVAVTL